MLMRAQMAIQPQTTVRVSRPFMIECDAAKQRQIIEKLRRLGVQGFPIRTATVYSVQHRKRTVIISCVTDEEKLPDIRAIDGIISVTAGNSPPP